MQLGLIGNDRDNSEWLESRLVGAGFIVRRAPSFKEAVRGGFGESLSALMIDLGVSDPRAAQWVMPLREANFSHPLMVLSARGDWREKVDCLDAGADDYVIKPVRSEEIVARLRAIIRRSAGGNSNRLRLGDLSLDLTSRCAWLGSECLDLTRNEFRLLRLFVFHPEKVLSNEEIRRQLYPVNDKVTDNAVEVLIARLRRKVGQSRIRTMRGIGYRFECQNDPGETGSVILEACRGGTSCGVSRNRMDEN